jgi:hypothetical protein
MQPVLLLEVDALCLIFGLGGSLLDGWVLSTIGPPLYSSIRIEDMPDRLFIWDVQSFCAGFWIL